ncbi:MAG: DUF3047 domain-containing protein [bacterium]
MALIVLAVAALAQVVIAVEGLTLDDLSTTKIGNFPKRWRTWPLQRGDAEKVYRVAEEGGKRFIKAYDSEDLSQQIFLNFNWQVQERPMLSWRWRVTKLPEGAAESNDATNDSACGVYVVVGKYSGHAIKYVWSSSLPAGNVTTRHDGKLKIKVLDSGQARTGSWVAHSVDVRTDYESLFGKPLEKNPSGIGMLTDGNAVHKPSGCDYADFAISGKGQ